MKKISIVTNCYNEEKNISILYEKVKEQMEKLPYEWEFIIEDNASTDNTVNVMNAAWGTMISRDQVLLILSKSHKTVENILKRNAFTISIPSSNYTTEADYFGVVSGNNIENKLAHANLTSTKSNNIDAPIINELPISLECTFIKYHEDEYIEGIIAKVENIYADESVITNDKIDVSLLKAIAYNPYTNEYYEVSNKVGNAFKDGLKLK